MATFIAFGPRSQDQSGSRGARFPGPTDHAFGIWVEEDVGRVAEALNSGDIYPFKRVWGDERHEVHVNPANVAYIQAVED